MGLPLNRALRDEDGQMYDAVAGDFLVVGLGEEDFASLTMGDMYTIQKYLEGKSVTLMIDRDKLTCICID